MSFLSIGNARKWLKRNSHTRGLLPSRQVTGKHLPFPPPTPLPWFFFLPSTTLLSTSPIHSLPFSMPLFPSPSLLCLLKHKCFKFRFQNEWRVTSKVTVNEWLLPVMVSRHTTYHATARMHTHTHAVRSIPVRYSSGVKTEKGKFSGQLRLLEHLAVKSTILPRGRWCSLICRKSHGKDAFSDVGITL